jgi:hypothetical protein
MGLPSKIVKTRENRVKHAGDFHRLGQQSESLVNARKRLPCEQTSGLCLQHPAGGPVALRPDKVERLVVEAPASPVR